MALKWDVMTAESTVNLMTVNLLVLLMVLMMEWSWVVPKVDEMGGLKVVLLVLTKVLSKVVQ